MSPSKKSPGWRSVSRQKEFGAQPEPTTKKEEEVGELVPSERTRTNKNAFAAAPAAAAAAAAAAVEYYAYF